MKHKSILAAIAAALATTAAMANITDLDSQLFRFDFSKGTNEFSSVSDFTGYNIIGTSTAPTNGPNGASSAATITTSAWKEFSSANTLSNSWTIATSLSPAAVNNAVVFSVGRLNKSGSRAVAICTSSDKSKLLVRLLYNNGSCSCAEKEMTGLGDITQGFHTLVITYESGENNHGTLKFYWDGVEKQSHTYSQDTKWFGIPSSPGGIQFNTLVSRGNYTSTGGKTFVYKNGIHSFYDFRFYSGVFDNNDVTAYNAHFRCTYPFRPDAYIEASGCNGIDTGYLAKPNETRYVADYLYLSPYGQSRIFIAEGDLISALYVRGENATGNLAWSMNGTIWVNTSKSAGRLRRTATLDAVNRIAAVTNHDDRTSFYTSTNAMGTTTSSATETTLLFAQRTDGDFPLKNMSKSRIYSFEIDENGTPNKFLAPATNDVGEAGFRDVLTGTFYGDCQPEAPERPLRFYNGVGCADDYKYESDTLYAKCYAMSEDVEKGTVKFGSESASGTATAWVPYDVGETLTATPAAGYVFAGWTGDTWLIKQGSVREAVITVSGERASQLCATFARSANPVSSYAQSGTSALLAHFDGIENVGAGMHQDAAPTWIDLMGNLTLTKTGSAGFISDAWKADGSSYFAATSQAVKDALAAKTFTLEMVISHPFSQNDYEYWAYFGAASATRHLVVDLRKNDSSNKLVQGLQYRANKWNNAAKVPVNSGMDWNKRQYIAVVCNGDNVATAYYDGTNKFHSVSGTTNPSSTQIGIGANGADGGCKVYDGSQICAVRMTSRALNADELMRNWYIDTQRFNMTTVPDGYRFVDGVLQVRITGGVTGVEFSTDGGTTWGAGEVWTTIDEEVTLYARYADDHELDVSFNLVPTGATISGNSVTFTPARPWAVSVGFPTLNVTGAAVWGEAGWEVGGASCAAPTSGNAIVNVSGDASLTLNGDVSLANLYVTGSGLLTIFTGSHTFTVSATDRESSARYIVCEGTDDTAAVWTGGASGDFSTASNWRGNAIPQDGWRVILANDTAASLTNNIAEFCPSNIEFAAGSAQITVSGNAITNLVTVKNYAEAHHVFSNAVFFADNEVADILGASSEGNYIKYLGGMTMYLPPMDPAAGNSRAEATGIWIAGNVTITADIPDWTPGTSICFLRLIECGTLTIPHSVVVTGVPNFLVGLNTTLHIMGDMTLNCSSGIGYFSNYIAGMMIIDGWAKNIGVTCRFSEQQNGLGWIKAYGIDSTTRFALNGAESTGDAGRWELGAGGITADTQIWVQDRKVAYIRATADFTIAGDVRLSEGSNNSNHPKLYLEPQGHTITLAPSVYAGNSKNASIIVQGDGTVSIESDLTPATGFQCNGTATVAVKPGVSLGAGSVSVASGATFKVSESGALDRAGNMTIADGATLAFNFTERATAPTLALASGKTATISGAVNVKVSATDDLRVKGGIYALTSGFDFTGKTVNVVDQPEWVKSVEIVDGNLVLTAKGLGLMLIVK